MKEDLRIFTPSKFFLYDTCPHWIWHDLYGNPQLKGEVPELALKLMEQGVLHEQEYMEGMECEEVAAEDMKEAVMRTLELMEQGADRIYQGAIQYREGNVLYRGRPDLLEKRAGASELGDHYYVPVDIKSAKELKPTHKMQLVLYAKILEHAQGRFPDETAIINKAHARVPFAIEHEDISRAERRIEEIVSVMMGRKPPLKLTRGCKDSPWFSQCLEEAEEAEDLALIYRLDSRAFEGLREAGIDTIHDLAEADLGNLPRIPRASPKTLGRAKLQAQALVRDEIIWKEEPEVPDAPLKLYFDIEGDPLLQVEYLFGFWVEGDPNGAYASMGEIRWDKPAGKYFLYFLAERPEDEEEMWKKFVRWLEILPEEYLVYHFADYERSRTRMLAERYATESMAFEHFHARLVDLSKIVADSVVFPLYFYSIKDIARSRFLNYQWRHEKAGGGQSIFWYEQWLETGDRKVLEDIINYNEDDVRATEYLYDWLARKGKEE